MTTDETPIAPQQARQITATDFWACISMTAMFFFIVGGLTAEALSIQQAKHLKNTNDDRHSQKGEAKP